jgi:hypothetical protein
MVPASPPPRHASNRIARVAFAMTLVFLVVGLTMGIVALRSLGLWQLSSANTPNDTFAKLAAGCLFVAMACNAVAFIASIWGWWHGTDRSVLILAGSGVGILASLGCSLSLVP